MAPYPLRRIALRQLGRSTSDLMQVEIADLDVFDRMPLDAGNDRRQRR